MLNYKPEVKVRVNSYYKKNKTVDLIYGLLKEYTFKTEQRKWY